MEYLIFFDINFLKRSLDLNVIKYEQSFQEVFMIMENNIKMS